MTGAYGEIVRQALGLAVQILGDMPAESRPVSNIPGMRWSLAGGSSGSPDRDSPLVAQGVVVALAWQTCRALSEPIPLESESSTVKFNSRANDFAELLSVIPELGVELMGALFARACDHIAPYVFSQSRLCGQSQSRSHSNPLEVGFHCCACLLARSKTEAVRRRLAPSGAPQRDATVRQNAVLTSR